MENMSVQFTEQLDKLIQKRPTVEARVETTNAGTGRTEGGAFGGPQHGDVKSTIQHNSGSNII